MDSLRRSRSEAEQCKRLRLQDHVRGCRVYEFEITVWALRHLNRRPEKVRHAALEFSFGPIADYRIIYEIFEDDQIVLIHRVQNRRDAYRPR